MTALETKAEELSGALANLRRWNHEKGDYPFVIGAVPPILEALDEFTGDTVEILRGAAYQLGYAFADDPSPMGHAARDNARALTIIAAHVEKLAGPGLWLPSK